MRLLGWELSLRRKAVDQSLSPVGGRGGWFSLVHEPYPGAWQRNVTVDRATVLQFAVVYACIARISGDVGKLRCRILRRDSNGIWAETDNSAFSPVLRTPNSYQTPPQFFSAWAGSKLRAGNAYVWKERDARGVVNGMHVLEPTAVMPLVAPDGAVFYRLNSDNLSGLPDGGVTVPASEIIHDRMNCLFHPLVGVSPIYACGLPATVGLQIQNNSAKFFGNDSRPTGILMVPGAITAEQSALMRQHWEENYGPNGAGKTAVLGNGLTYQPISVNAVDSQMTEQMKASVEAVCTAFGVPPFKIGIGEMPPYQSADIVNQIYYQDCLQVHLEEIEACLNAGMELPPDLWPEFDVEMGLLRMDQGAIIKAIAEGVKAGVVAPNEGRAKIGLPPKTGGDSPMMQQQQFSLEALAERDANKPFSKPEPAAPATPANDDPPAEPDPAATEATAAYLASEVRSMLMKAA